MDETTAVRITATAAPPAAQEEGDTSGDANKSTIYNLSTTGNAP